MSITVTARHMSISDKIQEYANEKAEQIFQNFPRVEHIHVVMDVEKHMQKAEVIVQAKNHIRVDASEQTENLTASLDSAFEKIERQLRKMRDKVQSHRIKTSQE